MCRTSPRERFTWRVVNPLTWFKDHFSLNEIHQGLIFYKASLHYPVLLVTHIKHIYIHLRCLISHSDSGNTTTLLQSGLKQFALTSSMLISEFLSKLLFSSGTSPDPALKRHLKLSLNWERAWWVWVIVLFFTLGELLGDNPLLGEQDLTQHH